MQDNIDFEFAESAVAEAPLVIAYFVALIVFASAWSTFGPPTVSVTELKNGIEATLQAETAEWMGM
jgi:hypothetical protein